VSEISTPAADAPGRPEPAVTVASDDELGPPPARTWFARDVLSVARDLLGALVSTASPDGRVVVRITEVEAYRGADDPASHAFRGRSVRNEQMFRVGGHLYVYRHLGLHHCLNVVTGPAGEPSAVLLRAGEVVGGADLAWRRRAASGAVYSAADLAQGPARLAVALGLDVRANGVDLAALAPAPAQLGGATAVRLVARSESGAVASGPRVGVGREGSDPRLFPWRLWLDGEPTVTRYRAGYR
jgi:DNA-3-methyladenine glycosylase